MIQVRVKGRYAAVVNSTVIGVAMLLGRPHLAKADTLGKFEPKQLQEDFQIARHSLEEGHPGLYRHTSKDELDRLFGQAEKSLNRPMDSYEFYRVIAPTIAAIKCGHTGVAISPDVREKTERAAWLPFDIKVLRSKAYIFRDYAENGKLSGKEIRSI